jgi:hypothetical protein
MTSLIDSVDTHWFRFLSRGSLVGGLMLLSLLLLGITVVLPAGQRSILPAEYGELVAAIDSPALYRLFAAFDLAVWLALGGLFVTLAAIFAGVAPIRSALIRACGVGQVMGAFGAGVRLFGVTDLAARYASTAPDQQAALLLPYLNLQWVLNCAFDTGSMLWGAAFVLAASVAWSSAVFPRGLAALLAAPGILLLSSVISFILTGVEFEFLLLPGLVLLLVTFCTLAVIFWRPTLPTSLIERGVAAD